jgi:DNA-directed RNA polymerase specialized sigma24 family protein
MPDPLFDDLRQLRRDRERANAEIDKQEAQVIALIRAKGLTWEQIGQEFGISKQAAWERYGPKVEE